MAAPYILYGDVGSGSATSELLLAEIGAPVELRAVPLSDDSQLSADHRRINPLGRIPVLLLPDGTVVTESLAIALLLADRHPGAGLLPPAAESARAVVLRWMALLAGEFYPHVTRYDYPDRFSADPAHAPAIRERAREMGPAVMDVVEANAPFGLDGQGPYLLGERFSAADIYLAVLAQWMGQAKLLPAKRPRLARLSAAVAARPRLAAVWRKHFPG